MRQPGGEVPDRSQRPSVNGDQVPLGHEGMDMDDLACLDDGYDEPGALPEELGPHGLPLPAEPRQVLGFQTELMGDRLFVG